MNDKIINPESGRPVKILGKIGQKVLGNLFRQSGGKSSSSKNKPKKKNEQKTPTKNLSLFPKKVLLINIYSSYSNKYL